MHYHEDGTELRILTKNNMVDVNDALKINATKRNLKRL